MVWENASFSEVVGMLENARVAAEGLELRLQTSQKRTPVFKGEAKPEAVNVWSVGCWRERLQEDA